MNPDAPEPTQGVPETPIELTDTEAERFSQICCIAMRMRVLSPDDIFLLTMAAQRAAEIDRYRAVLQDEGEFYVTPSGQMKAHPAIAVKNAAQKHLHVILTEFGMSPAARSKVVAPDKPEENPFAALAKKAANDKAA